MEYHGNWNAATNTPTLVNGTGNAGDTYRCSVAGSVDFGAGLITFAVGDFVIYSGAIWERSINSNEVVSVNGKKGVVTGLVESIGGETPDSNGAIATIPLTGVRVANSANSMRVPYASPNGNILTGILTAHATSLGESIIPIRQSGGHIAVPVTPTQDNYAASKQYVDNGLSSAMPVGAGVEWWGADLPDATWAWANGQAISRSAHPLLFSRFGTRYGAGNGTTTFNLPDKRERVSIGKSDMGETVSQGLIDQGVTGVDASELGSKGGQSTVGLTADQNGPHTHRIWSDTNTETVLAPDGIPGEGGQALGTGNRKYIEFGPNTQSSGSGEAHSNVQPVIVCNYIIKVLP